MSKSQRKKIFLWIGIGSALLAISIFGFIFYSRYSFPVYQNKQTGVRIRYPREWQVVERPQGGALVAFVSPRNTALDVFRENVNISVVDLSNVQVYNQDQLNELIISQLVAVFENAVDYVVSEPFYAAGQQGYKLIYSGREDDQPKAMHVWIMKNNAAYVLTYLSFKNEFDVYIDDVNRMVKSWRMTP